MRIPLPRTSSTVGALVALSLLTPACLDGGRRGQVGATGVVGADALGDATPGPVLAPGPQTDAALEPGPQPSTVVVRVGESNRFLEGNKADRASVVWTGKLAAVLSDEHDAGAYWAVLRMFDVSSEPPELVHHEVLGRAFGSGYAELRRAGENLLAFWMEPQENNLQVQRLRLDGERIGKPLVIDDGGRYATQLLVTDDAIELLLESYIGAIDDTYRMTLDHEGRVTAGPDLIYRTDGSEWWYSVVMDWPRTLLWTYRSHEDPGTIFYADLDDPMGAEPRTLFTVPSPAGPALGRPIQLADGSALPIRIYRDDRSLLIDLREGRVGNILADEVGPPWSVHPHPSGSMARLSRHDEGVLKDGFESRLVVEVLDSSFRVISAAVDVNPNAARTCLDGVDTAWIPAEAGQPERMVIVWGELGCTAERQLWISTVSFDSL